MLVLHVIPSAESGDPSLALQGDHLTVGRDPDCDLTLEDPSLAVVHAQLTRRGDRWMIQVVEGSGGEEPGPRLEVNGTAVLRAPLEGGDRLRLGRVELQVRRAGTSSGGSGAPPPTAPPAQGHEVSEEKEDSGVREVLAEATLLRRLEDLELPWSAVAGERSDVGGGGVRQPAGSESAEDPRRQADVGDPEETDPVVASLLELAHLLLRTDSVSKVLDHAMEVAFRILPGERSHAFLLSGDGRELHCVAARVRGREARGEVARGGEPAGEDGGTTGDGRLPAGPPVSRSLLQAVLDRRMALVTDDAARDERIAPGQSILVHRIRSAMLAPLWSGSRILGVLQIDTSRGIGVFTERHLELLAAVANFAAVAIERIENGRRVERELAVRARLERYHSPGVIEDILERREDGSRFGGPNLRPAEVTVMFADLVGFTPFCAASEPAEVVDLLGEFFDEAVAAVFEAGGTLDKFLGDAVMAFFGAPVAHPDFAQRAVGAAIRLRRRMKESRQRRHRAGRPALEVTIAMASGPVMVGEVGSSQRVDYTVLGDTVNLASRLEEVATAGEVILDLRTVELLEGTIPTRPRDTVELQGLGREVRLHVLVD